jgi:hypothetical protein
MPAGQVDTYLDSQEFADDCYKLLASSPGCAEGQRWEIRLKWSENLRARGYFPTKTQSYAMMSFVLGNISIDQMIVQVQD